MKKNNNKGFFLVETVIVSTFVCTVLIFLFIQIRNINKNYQRTFSYNTVNSLYSLDNFKQYLKEYNLDTLKLSLGVGTYYLDLTNCNSTYITEETTYCNAIYDKLKIDKIIMVKEDMASFFENNFDSIALDQNFKNFIKYIGSTEGSTRYLLLASFTDGTYASLAFI